MKVKSTGAIIASTLLLLAISSSRVSAAVITFEEIARGSSGYWNGSDGSGGLTTGGVTFRNDYNAGYSSWSGFAISNRTDTTTAGWGNQYSAYPGSGAGGSTNYAVGFTGGPTEISFAALDVTGLGMSIANTTYTVLSMLTGDDYAKKFGGPTGTDPDWLKLTITGSLLGVSGVSFDFYLADFRFADSAQDYILTDWSFVDLSALGTVDKIAFNVTTSDNTGGWPNTPTYFALDHFLAIPEPSSSLLLSLAGLTLITRRKR